MFGRLFTAFVMLPALAFAQTLDTDPILDRNASECLPGQHYPAFAILHHHQGDVTLNFTVNTDGTVSNVLVSQSSGYPELDEAAIECVVKFIYKPATKDTQPLAKDWHATIHWFLT